MSRKSVYGSLYKKTTHKDSEGSWAVSYADFLMVLLSFFIIFFSYEENNPLKKISFELKKVGATDAKGSGSGGEGGHRILASTATGLKVNQVILEIANSVTGATAKFDKSPDKVILDLPVDMYRVGSYEADPSILDPIIEQLRPYSQVISIIVVGHADNSSFGGKKRNIMRDNLTLSSVRASFASMYIKSKLTDTDVWTQGVSASVRNTRSLSIIIELKKQGQL